MRCQTQPAIDTGWIVSHLITGWKSFAGFLLDATERGVKFDATELVHLEAAKRLFDQVIERQKSR